MGIARLCTRIPSERERVPFGPSGCRESGIPAEGERDVKTRLAMSAVLCGFALTACSAGGTASPAAASSPVSKAAAAPSPNTSASQQAAYESYHAALLSNEA